MGILGDRLIIRILNSRGQVNYSNSWQILEFLGGQVNYLRFALAKFLGGQVNYLKFALAKKCSQY